MCTNLFILVLVIRETVDSYSITASPNFGSLGRTPSIKYSSLDVGSQSEEDLGIQSPFLSGSVLAKQESDKNLRRPVVSVKDEVISSGLEFSEEGCIHHGCSFIQTVFNGKLHINQGVVLSHSLFFSDLTSFVYIWNRG